MVVLGGDIFLGHELATAGFSPRAATRRRAGELTQRLGHPVGARSEIYLLVRNLADTGVAIVVVSSEVEEVLGLSDRVLHDGPAAGVNENEVLDLVTGGTAA